MKPVMFENVVNRQQYVCENKREVTVIDDVEYITVSEVGSPRKHLMRKDVLRLIDTQNKKVKS